MNGWSGNEGKIRSGNEYEGIGLGMNMKVGMEMNMKEGLGMNIKFSLGMNEWMDVSFDTGIKIRMVWE